MKIYCKVIGITIVNLWRGEILCTIVNLWITIVNNVCTTQEYSQWHCFRRELKLINKNSINAFARAFGRSRRPETDTHTFRSGSYKAHLYVDTINLLLSVGEAVWSSINSDTPVSPVPYAVSPHIKAGHSWLMGWVEQRYFVPAHY
jgi:hypothetical protein